MYYFVGAAKGTAYFVIPAKAGIQFLALALGRYRENRLTSLCFLAHPCAPVTSLCLPKRK